MQMQVFDFQNEVNVRTVQIDGETFWVAKDVCAALGYSPKSNASRLVSSVPPEWRGVQQIHTPSGTQDMVVLSEAGLYFFLSRSDKPKALPMQKWVAGEVIPCIRKTGVYIDEAHPAVKAARQPDLFTPTASDQPAPVAQVAALQAQIVTLTDALHREQRHNDAHLFCIGLLKKEDKPKPAPKEKFSNDEVRQACAKKMQGKTNSQIAREMDRSVSAISQITRSVAVL